MFRTRKSRAFRFIAISALLLTAGCVVGPNFKKPAAPDVGGYTPTPITPPLLRPMSPGGRRSAWWTGKTFRESGGSCFTRSPSTT